MELSDDEYEEWSPSVLKRWGALMERQERDAKHYTAFLRFALKCYDIPAKSKPYGQIRRGDQGSFWNFKSNMSVVLEQQKRCVGSMARFEKSCPPSLPACAILSTIMT